MPDPTTQPPASPVSETASPPAEATSPTSSTEYSPIFFTSGTLPAAQGTIAETFATIPMDAQRKAAEDLHSFLWTSNGGDMLRLNLGQTLLTCLVAIPATGMVKIVYGLGVGSAGIGEANPLEGKMLMLYGEGDKAIGPPEILVLGSESNQRITVNDPSDTEVQERLTAKGKTFGRYLIAPRNVTSSAEILRIAAIPAYLVYDGFTNDLHAAEVYERVLQCTHTSPMLEHAKSFLRSILVGPLRNEDQKPFVPQDQWNQMAPVAAKRWRVEKLKALFPLVFGDTPTSTPTPSQPTQPLPNETSLFHSFFAEWQKSQKAAQSQPDEEKKEESTTLKASEFEKNIIKTLCGLPKEADETMLPKWYVDLFNKNQDDKDRDHIVANVLNGTLRFEDAEIPVYPELKKIILKRNWVGGEAGGNPKFAYACYGLTPFAMMDLSEDQIAQMEFDQQFIQDSSTVTPADLRSSKQKLVAVVPASGTKWKNMLLKFTNLLFVLFKGECPLYMKMLDIAKALRKYPEDVLDALPMHAKASVLWIIHLQARHFAQGKMDPAHTSSMCLPAFQLMYNQICSTAVHVVSIAGLPAKLEASNTPPTKKGNLDETGHKQHTDNDTKKHKGNEKEKVEKPWNATLKAALEGPLKQAGNPSLKDIARHCNLLRDDIIIPNTAKEDCRQWLLFGKCRYGKKCRFNHNTATDEQAKAVIVKLEKFIAEPDTLKQGEP